MPAHNNSLNICFAPVIAFSPKNYSFIIHKYISTFQYGSFSKIFLHWFDALGSVTGNIFLSILTAIFQVDLGWPVPERLHSRTYLQLRMTEVMVTTEAIRRAKLLSNRHHQQTNTQRFTGRMPFLSPNQQCQSTEWMDKTDKNTVYYWPAYSINKR